MILRSVFLLLLLTPALGPAVARELPQPADDVAPSLAAEELRQALRSYFEKRLRAELALSDEQLEHMLPRFEELEQARAASRRERMAIRRRIERGLNEGATDVELEQMLHRLQGMRRVQAEAESATMREIDQVLSVRQRVQLQIFLEQFRSDMQSRMRALRRSESDADRRTGPARRRAPGAEP